LKLLHHALGGLACDSFSFARLQCRLGSRLADTASDDTLPFRVCTLFAWFSTIRGVGTFVDVQALITSTPYLGSKPMALSTMVQLATSTSELLTCQ
jgi:hypothetical protein